MLKNSFILICLLFSASICGKIVEIRDLAAFEEASLQLEHHSLVIFDIDYTILTPKDAALKPCGKGLRKKYLHPLDPQKREWLQSILGIDGEEELVDIKIPCLIQNLQAKGIPVIALTALETGRYGKIANLEEWRLYRLKTFGIDFTRAFQYFNPLSLIQCGSDPHPLFKDGVLFTNMKPKGDVLNAFLHTIGHKPTKILFIDDSLSQLHSVESTAQKLDIEFIGFHTRILENTPCEYNQALGEFQFQYLIEHERWLRDKEAMELFKNQQSTYATIIPK